MPSTKPLAPVFFKYCFRKFTLSSISCFGSIEGFTWRSFIICFWMLIPITPPALFLYDSFPVHAQNESCHYVRLSVKYSTGADFK
ncbi:Hypothetical protein ACI5QL_00322 [Bacillus velezensis]